MHTPEFLAWAIEHTCSLRGSEDGSDPERTERQLRAVRAVSDARRELRVLEGICVQSLDGFRLAEALAMFGGEAAVNQACGHCPANALAITDAHAFAGCYGVAPLPDDVAPFHARVEQAILASATHDLTATRPRWYGLWIDSPLAGAELLEIARLLQPAADGLPELESMLTAFTTAHRIGSRVHVRLYPPGQVAGPEWRLIPHCPRCRSAWPTAKSRQCGVCGYAGSPAPDKRRLARGKRPYFPLERLLGPQQAAAFLARYEEQRAQPAQQLPG